MGSRGGLDVLEIETSLPIARIRTQARRLNKGLLLGERHNYEIDDTVQTCTVVRVSRTDPNPVKKGKIVG